MTKTMQAFLDDHYTNLVEVYKTHAIEWGSEKGMNAVAILVSVACHVNLEEAKKFVRSSDIIPRA